LDETELVSPILKTAEWHAGHERHAFLSIRGIPRWFTHLGNWRQNSLIAITRNEDLPAALAQLAEDDPR
jgi:hypothetical protein